MSETPPRGPNAADETLSAPPTGLPGAAETTSPDRPQRVASPAETTSPDRPSRVASPADETFEMDRDSLPTGELPSLPKREPGVKPRIRPIGFGIRMALGALVLYFAIALLPKFQEAASELTDVDPFLIVLGFTLSLIALFFYSLLTRAALGEAALPLSAMRMFRIQLSTKALTNVVPGGNAAGSALGYRLLTLSGVRGPDAGFALATAGIGSAVVLNLVFWLGLIVSVPRRGVNPFYGTAALAGIIVIGIAAFLVLGIMEGQGRAESAVRWIARRLRVDEDRVAGALHQVATRLEELIGDRHLLNRVVVFAMLNWVIDAAALWVFVRAFGESLDIDALIVAFGLANLLAAIPITPGGLGYVDLVYVATLVGFGLTENAATLGVASYRFAQFFFPIFLGAIAYASLRLGPWRIERRDRLSRLRELARTEPAKGETKIDFALRFGTRPAADHDAAEDASAAGGDAIADEPQRDASEPSDVPAAVDLRLVRPVEPPAEPTHDERADDERADDERDVDEVFLGLTEAPAVDGPVVAVPQPANGSSHSDLEDDSEAAREPIAGRKPGRAS